MQVRGRGPYNGLHGFQNYLFHLQLFWLQILVVIDLDRLQASAPQPSEKWLCFSNEIWADDDFWYSSSIQICCLAQDSTVKMLIGAYALFFLRDQQMIVSFSVLAMSTALVCKKFWQKPSKVYFPWKKNEVSVTRCCLCNIYKAFNLLGPRIESVSQEW